MVKDFDEEKDNTFTDKNAPLELELEFDEKFW